MRDLGITDLRATGATGCGCGGACGGHGHANGHAERHGHEATAPGQTFAVAGMTCDHCVRSVTEELAALDGVERVSIDLVPGAESTVVVSASRALSSAEVRAAVEDAGYTLVH